MRILADYRSALRERTGVGEYTHNLLAAYAKSHSDDVTLFSSSWKDRLRPGLASELGVHVVDRRIPVRVLNLLWHRAGWPPIEALAGRFDVVHSFHPLMIPARRAARVVTVHDLFFLDHPERTTAEIRRDYPLLTADHARQAEAIITPSHHVRNLVAARLGVMPERIYVCSSGSPVWRGLGRAPNIPPDGYLLFVGTLEPRKNLGALLDAYTILGRMRTNVPKLVVVGRVTPSAQQWVDQIAAAPLAGHVELRGYVPESGREALFAGARALILPSFDEGFGLPVLEAMSAGVPVVVSNRGALPEVVGNGGIVVDPGQPDELATALASLIDDRETASRWASAGLERARSFSWDTAVATLRLAYTDAVARRAA